MACVSAEPPPLPDSDCKFAGKKKGRPRTVSVQVHPTSANGVLQFFGGRMEKLTKRARSSNWNHAQTMALTELKREASLNKEDGRLVWERIAQTLSSRFPGQIRTGVQCRRRWDTLVKVYNYIEDYCIVTGAQDHRELDEGELASMKLDTAYQQDWYDIVEQVCSQRKRKERCDRDPMLPKQMKGSSTGYYSVEFPEHPPNSYTLCSASTSETATHHEQSTHDSTTTYAAQVSSSPILEDKLSPEEGLRFMNENDDLVLEVPWQHGQVSHEVSQEPQVLESTNLLPYTFPAENGAQLKEPLQYNWWDLIEIVPFETSAEIEKSTKESELTEPFDRYLVSVELGAQPKEPLQDHVREDSLGTANASSAKESDIYEVECPPTVVYRSANQPHSLPFDLPDWGPPAVALALVPPEYEWNPRAHYGILYTGGLEFGPAPRNTEPFDRYLESVGLGAQPKEPLQDLVRDDSLETSNASSPKESDISEVASSPILCRGVVPTEYDWRGRSHYGRSHADDRRIRVASKNDLPLADGKSSSVSVNQYGLIPSATRTSSTSSRSSDSTISRQSRRWSLKVIVLNILQCFHTCGRK